MKKLSEIILCLMLAIFNIGQNQAQNVPEKTSIVDAVAPVSHVNNSNRDIQDSNTSLLTSYLYCNIKYPDCAINSCFQGTEVVQFTVLPNGELTNVKVINSVCPEIDQEVIRVLKTTCEMWVPGNQDGTPCELQKELSIVFHLDGVHAGTTDEYFMKKARSLYVRGNHALYAQNKPEKALRLYNDALKYKPTEEALLLARGMAKLQLNDPEGAKTDWNRVTELVERGGIENNLTLAK